MTDDDTNKNETDAAPSRGTQSIRSSLKHPLKEHKPLQSR